MNRGRRAWLVSLAGAAVGLPAQAAPPRVITVGGALTEIVYRLGGQSFLVATDTTSTYPAAAQALPKIGYQRSLSAEGVLALQPTILLAVAEAGPPATLQQLAAAGVRLVRIPGEHTFEALLGSVQQVAAGLNLELPGRELSQTLRQQWATTRASMRAGKRSPKVLFVLSHAANNVQVAGEGTAADAMIRLAAGTNALSGFQGYRPMGTEAVIAAAPDIILTTREGLDALGGFDALLARPGLALTPAGKARHVLAHDALFLLGFGPRLPQAVHELALAFGTSV